MIGLTFELKNLKECLFENYTTPYLRAPMDSNSWFECCRCRDTVQCLNWWNGESYDLLIVKKSVSSRSNLFSDYG